MISPPAASQALPGLLRPSGSLPEAAAGIDGGGYDPMGSLVMGWIGVDHMLIWLVVWNHGIYFPIYW